MVSCRPTAIYFSYDDMEATIDRTGTARRFWAQIYAMGDEFAARGESLSSRLRAILTTPTEPDNEQDCVIYSLYLLAVREESTQQRIYQRLAQNLRIDAVNADTEVIDRAYIRRRVAHIRARVDLFGDRAAIEEYARTSGLATEVLDIVEANEAELGILTEQFEDLERQWDVARRDFRHRVDQGELVQHPLGGWIERDELRHTGARTRITDVSSPASLDDIDKKSCPICLETFTTPQEAVRLTACSHVIHAACLDAWINCLAEKCNTCVLCRQTLFSRRPREPTSYLSWYVDLEGRHTDLDERIEILRMVIEHLIEILDEIQPSRVANSLGR